MTYLSFKLNKEGIWGTCIGNNLKANAVWFNIPLSFKEVVFNFRGQKVDSTAVGILGKEKVEGVPGKEKNSGRKKYMFFSCYSLNKIPHISKWKIDNAISIFLFGFCINMTKISLRI